MAIIAAREARPHARLPSECQTIARMGKQQVMAALRLSMRSLLTRTTNRRLAARRQVPTIRPISFGSKRALSIFRYSTHSSAAMTVSTTSGVLLSRFGHTTGK
jgi:hypothetical protein